MNTDSSTFASEYKQFSFISFFCYDLNIILDTMLYLIDKHLELYYAFIS